MEWPSPQELGVGGTLALAALAITLRTVWKWKANGNSNHAKSGDLDPADWERRIEGVISRVIVEAIDDKFLNVAIQREERMRDMVEEVIRQTFSGRNEEIRRMIREEMQHFYGLKGGIRR